MNKDVRTRLALMAMTLGVCAVVVATMAGCPSPSKATPTPTKTVRPVQVATATPPPTATPTLTPEPSPTPLPTPTATPTDPYAHAANVDPLTGLTVEDAKLLARRPLFVAVNNSVVARPQYGLVNAELVYEYIMEGYGITRYTAVFLANECDRIGPVRSARLVNFYLTPQYGGALVASGAGNDVRWWLKNKMPAPYLDIDLDDPQNNVYSWSVGSNYETRMQTSTAKLRTWLNKKKVEQDPKLRGFAFAEQAPTGAAAGQSVTIPFPSKVTWTYDAASGRYLRSLDGKPHLDAVSQKQLDASNVILQTVPHDKTTYVEDSLGDTSIRIITVGEGPVTILRDGVAITGTWKAGDTSMPDFRDAAGKVIALKPGSSWFELIAATNKVTLK